MKYVLMSSSDVYFLNRQNISKEYDNVQFEFRVKQGF
jgi:hypothetical protein